MSAQKHIIVIVRTDVTPEMEEEFNRWYNEEHLPLLLNVPGVLSGKRAVNTGSGLKYIAVYEHEHLDVQKTPAYQAVLQTEWAQKIRPHMLNLTREVYEAL